MKTPGTVGRAHVLLICVVFAAVIAIVSPDRETAVDDDWSYALMVRDLLEAGRYVSHDWVAAQPVFQIGWGAGFASVFGFSMATLRMSTLVLALGLLVTFYLLAREHDVSPRGALFVTLAFCASPLFLLLSFSFMTDVPFAACVTAALYFLTIGFRAKSVVAVLCGATALCAAILTRQFGVVIVPVVAWTAWRFRRSHGWLVALALVPPLVASGYQLVGGHARGSRTVDWLLVDQMTYLTNPAILFETLWRPAVATTYMGLFALPLAGAIWSRGLFGDVALRRQRILLVALSAAFILCVLGVGDLYFGRRFAMPLLPFTFEVMAAWPAAVGAILTLVAVVNGAFVVVALWEASPAGRVCPLSEGMEILVGAGVMFLIQWTVFYQYWDRYLLQLAPLVLIVVGRWLWVSRQPTRYETVTSLGLTATMVIAVAMWIRGDLARREAIWLASDEAVAAGSAPQKVASSWEWGNYNGFFDRFIASHPNLPRTESLHRVQDRVADEWRSVYPAEADVIVEERPSPIPDEASWTVIATRSYVDGGFRRHNVYTLRRSAVSLVSCTGGYPMERDATGWWSWTASTLDCLFKVSADSYVARVAFEYLTAGAERRVTVRVGSTEQPVMLSGARGSQRLEPVVFRSGVTRVSFHEDGVSPPVPLSAQDPRQASFAIKNLRFELVGAGQ